jgi:hypothetical protein
VVRAARVAVGALTPSELLDQGVAVAFGFFALGFLLVFAWGLLLGFIDFMRRFLG